LLSAWSRTTGVYENATNQAGRYTISNGVVTDTFTQMQWEQTAGTTPMVFSSVSGYCAAQTTGGLAGWRAPNIVELGTLIDYTSSTAPFLNTGFFSGELSANNYWSSSSDIGNSGNSWYYLISGYGRSYFQTTGTSSQVRCVRSCYPLPASSRYTVGIATSTGTVTDNVTGLIWQKVAPTTGGPNSNGTYPQSSAASYCSTLNLGGLSSGWRLPTVRELQTLVDYSKSYATLMMDTTVFSGEPANYFWSSSPLAGLPAYAWDVYLDFGDVNHGLVTNGFYVRCVR
jgi:hypothetical protein